MIEDDFGHGRVVHYAATTEEDTTFLEYCSINQG